MCLEGISQRVVLVPDLEPSVPSYWGEIWLNTFINWGESDHTNPISVIVFLGSEFAFSKSVE
jgi:hypothetical protein